MKCKDVMTLTLSDHEGRIYGGGGGQGPIPSTRGPAEGERRSGPTHLAGFAFSGGVGPQRCQRGSQVHVSGFDWSAYVDTGRSVPLFLGCGHQHQLSSSLTTILSPVGQFLAGPGAAHFHSVSCYFSGEILRSPCRSDRRGHRWRRRRGGRLRSPSGSSLFW